MSNEVSHVITLQFDAATFERLQALRICHFPPALNLIPAHLTLLHTASSDQTNRLKERWHRLDRAASLSLRFTGFRSLGRGTALVVESSGLGALRDQAMHTMSGSFSAQDRQKFNAHVTIQNKVDSAAAKALLEQLSASFTAWEGAGRGLLVWRYLGGPWVLDSVLSFAK